MKQMFFRSLAARPRGFTLVELMVGLAVGLFVSVIAISLFVSSRKLQSVNSASNRMSENARLAFDLLHKDLRLAGFRGCSDQFDREPVSVLNPGDGGFLVDANGVRGFRGSEGGFTPALPAPLQALSPAPLTGSDVISVRVPADALSLGLVDSMTSNTDAPNVGTRTAGHNLINNGDIVLMANCKSAVLFQVTGTVPPAVSGVLQHSVGNSPAPGNATDDLRSAYNRSDTALYRLQTRHYYVAPSVARAGTNSLWRLTVPPPATGAAAEEVVAGVDRLNISYGLELDSTADRAANRYITADAIAPAQWNNVLSARIQMLTATADNGTAQAASTVQFAGSSVSPGDRRLREVYTEVVAFRNQLP